MAKKKDHDLKRMQSTESKYGYYIFRKRVGGDKYKKLELKKYDPIIRKHVIFKEIKG
jgi:ribosomal protein L33